MRQEFFRKKFSQNAVDGQSVLARIWQALRVLRERIRKKAVSAAESAFGALLRMARLNGRYLLTKRPTKFAGKACADIWTTLPKKRCLQYNVPAHDIAENRDRWQRLVHV